MKHWWECRKLVNESPPEGHQQQQLRHLSTVLDQIHSLILTDWPRLPENWHRMPDGEPIYDWSVALHRKAVWLWVQLDSVEQDSLLWVLDKLKNSLEQSFELKDLTGVSLTVVSREPAFTSFTGKANGLKSSDVTPKLCHIQETWNTNFIFERAVSS